MSNADRFAALFNGYKSRYGRYDLSGDITPEEKVAGRARTVDRELTLVEYEQHIEGEVGIGVIPLREDDKVNFAAIDIDVYKDEQQKQKNLTHEDVALALADTPLVVTRSKSNGVHVWLFAKEPVSAELAADYLNAKAAEIGVAGTEVFPKQTQRHSKDDVGNWINLPYFGDKRTAVIPKTKGAVTKFADVDLDTFLKVAEAASTVPTEAWLREHTNPREIEQRDGSVASLPMFKDGPPCLQALCVGFPDRRPHIQRKFDRGELPEDQFNKQMAYTEAQLESGNRNDAFFNVAIYLRRRMNEQGDPDAVVDKDDLYAELLEAHTRWCEAKGYDDPKRQGIKDELKLIAAQAAKGKWGYRCTKAPLKTHCNRRVCLKRKFGVGTTPSEAGMGITAFTIVESEDRQYYMDVGGKRIYIPDAATLNSQAKFGEAVLNQTDRMWQTMADPRYKEMIDGLLQSADRIDPPPDSDKHAMMLNALVEFVNNRKIAKGKNDAGYFSGRVLLSDDQLEVWFKLDQFVQFLRQRGLNWPHQEVSRMLTSDRFNVVAKANTTIAGRNARPYVVNLTTLDRLMEEEKENNGEA